MLVPINNLGQYGVIRDTPSHLLPANAWTDARGVRFYDGSVWKSFGDVAVLGTPSVDPYYLYLHNGPSLQLWAYPGLAKVYATDGTTHTDITRAAGDYTGGVEDIWQGDFLGGIEIFNNGVDVPQAWINPALVTPLADLANWPANTTAKVIRSFRQYLIALNVTKSGINFPYLVKWSHVADPGTVPDSWDETDPTKDAGEYPLTGDGGHIVDALKLGDQLIIYTETQTWRCTWVGGRFIFDFKRTSFETGVVSPRSIVEFKSRHYVATEDDIIVHDGFQSESVLDDKMRRWYANQLDLRLKKRQYMVYNEREKEIWLCIPGAGNDHPSLALIYNVKDNTTAIRDLPQPTIIASAPIDPTSGGITFDSQTIPFDQMVGVFGQRTSNPGASRLVGAIPGGSKRFLLFDEGFSSEGSDFRGYVERLGIPLAGVGRDGNPILDERNRKSLTEVWPQIRQQNGTSVDIYVGGQEQLDGPVTWDGPHQFRPGVDEMVDCYAEGRYLAYRIETDDQSQWKLDSLKLNVNDLGMF